MSILFPVVGFFLALCGAFASRKDVPDRVSVAWTRDLLPILIALVIFCVGIGKFAPESDRTWLIVGVLLGAASAVLGSRASWSPSSALAWGLAMGMACQLVPLADRPITQVALIAAAGIACSLAGCPAAGLGAIAVAAADRLGKVGSDSDVLPMAGSVLALVALLAIVLGMTIGAKPTLRIGIAFLLICGGGLAIGSFWLKDSEAGAVIAVGGLCGLALNFLTPREGNVSSGYVGLAALIGVALATLAFSLARGSGMSLAFLAAIACLACSGNLRAALPLGPLLAIALFRDFRTTYPEVANAFEIGQHYTIIGILVGMVIPLVLLDWLQVRATNPNTRTGIAIGLWCLILVGCAPLTTVFLGTYGAAGFIIGAGLAGVAEALRSGSSVTSLAAGGGIAGAMMILFAWMHDFLELARDDKIHLLTTASIGILVVAIVIFALGWPGRNQEVAREAA